MLIQVRVHGRGGQGAVTASQVIAIAAFHDGRQSQAFPFFTADRMGAPAAAFARISDKKINLREQIYEPDYAIVLDPTLLNAVDFTKGVKEAVIMNCNVNIKLKKRLYVVDAEKIALEIIGKPFVNIAMIGAFSKITGLLSLNSIFKAVEEFFDRKGEDIIKKNQEVVKKVYEMVKV